MAGTSQSAYYQNWDKHAADLEKEEDAAEEEEKKQAAIIQAMRNERALPGASGYNFRKGHKTQFPDCKALPGESDVVAAFRVAGERRAAGVDAFKDGTVWGAQTAVDAWGQGVLALERTKNLIKYRPLRAVSAASVAEEAAGAAPAEPEEDGPGQEELDAMVVGLRLNLAQGLLKLREYESVITHCDKALELEPDNAKGLWRKASAVWGIRNPGLARETLQRLLEVEAGNPAALKMLAEIDQEEARKRVKRTGVKGTLPPRPAAESAKSTSCASDCAGEDSDEEGDNDDVSVLEFLAEWWARLRCCRRSSLAREGKED